MTIADSARSVVGHGISVVPVDPKSKRPTVATWDPLQQELPTPDAAFAMCRDARGFGVVGGKVSGNLEALDFDHKVGATYEQWTAAVEEYGLSDVLQACYRESTPSGGFHVIYRCEDAVDGNLTLARSDTANDKGRHPALIETRGEGGYCVVCPAPGYKALGGSLQRLPVLTKDQRDTFLALARTLNQLPPQPVCVPKERRERGTASDVLPGDDFNDRTEWADLLDPAGWTRGKQSSGRTYWTRPGKHARNGISASTGHGEQDLLWVFSSNCWPLEPEHSYSKFAFHALTEHGGDYSAAAKALYAKGYGTRREPTGEPLRTTLVARPRPEPKPHRITPIKLQAFHGLAGDFVRRIEPETESDPVALLVQFLAMFGHVIGRGSFVTIEGSRHHANLYVLLLGATGAGRKGTSLVQVENRFRAALGSEWEDKVRMSTGLGSGEGVIFAIRDARVETKVKDGSEEPDIVDPGVKDKRLLVYEPEFAALLEAMSRRGSTLSTTLRNGWDGRALGQVVKNAPLRCENPHLSIIAHITPAEFDCKVQSSDVANGFLNRFLPVMVHRSKLLPHGGDVDSLDFEDLNRRLRSAIEYAETLGEVRLDNEARDAWERVYGPLSEDKPGMVGEMSARGPAHVKRLAMVYALLDEAPMIGRDHLLAALAVWESSFACIESTFGGRTGMLLADLVLKDLKARPEGMSRTDINDRLGGKTKAHEIAQALSKLHEAGLAFPTTVRSATKPKEVWQAAEYALADSEDSEDSEDSGRLAG